jgi:hypothetical protein
MIWTVRASLRAALRRWHALALLMVSAVGCSDLAVADTTYWRVTIDRVTVVSDGNAARCSRLAGQFLAFESVLRDLADWSPDFVPPPVAMYSLSQQDALRVILSESEKQKQRASGMMIFSKYLPGRDFNINVIVNEGGTDDPLQSVLLLYAQGLLTTGPTQRHPPWFQLGVANLLNGLMIRSDGSVLLNRSVAFEPISDGAHRSQAHYDLEKLLSLRAMDFGATLDYKEFSRRAREWAQFGLLTTEERRSHYRELALLMRQGEPVADAVKDTFGVSLEQLTAEFEAGAWRKEVQFRLAAHAPLPVVPQPKLESAEANILLQVVAARASREGPESL